MCTTISAGTSLRVSVRAASTRVRLVDFSAVAPAQLDPATALEFRVRPGNFAGYRVDMTSIVLEAD